MNAANYDHAVYLSFSIINQVRKVGTSVIWTISLIRYASDQPMDKGVQIIEVALYYSTHPTQPYILATT